MSTTEKPTLKLVPRQETAELHLGGLAPSHDMQPAKYRVACQSAWAEELKKGRDWRITLEFRVIDGPHTGTELAEYIIAAKAGGRVSPIGRYAQECAVALGRQLDVSDKIKEPASIFKGKVFLAFVGFRKTEKPKGGKYSDDYALLRKDSADYLRVHKLLELVEL